MNDGDGEKVSPTSRLMYVHTGKETTSCYTQVGLQCQPLTTHKYSVKLVTTYMDSVKLVTTYTYSVKLVTTYTYSVNLVTTYTYSVNLVTTSLYISVSSPNQSSHT